MIGKISGFLIIASLIFCIATGKIDETAKAAVQGAEKAVTLTVSLCGMTCLWCGVMNAAKEAGALKALTKLLSPLIGFLFPDAANKKHGTDELAASMAANFLGIGNAATPLAISAMQALADNNGYSDTSSDDMVTFTVLGTAPLSLLPTTIITMRNAAGSVDPFCIVLPVWICSFCCTFAAVLLSKLGNIKKQKKKGNAKPKIRSD